MTAPEDAGTPVAAGDAAPPSVDVALGAGRAGRPADEVVATDVTDGYRFWVIPHTHWDREWYLPFEHFRMRMVRMIDELLDLLAADPRFRRFTLDGQAVLLEDYVAVRPEREAELRARIAEGRIAIGPSYTLPDEFLVSGESLVRNLLAGRETCREFGGEPMAVGYLPDTFGHVAQLPQILRGFGLDTFVFWRGIDDDAPRLGLVFAWEAPDGSRVTAIRQPDSYGNGSGLGRWIESGVSVHDEPDRWGEAASHRFERLLRKWGGDLRRAGISDWFLMNGGDHHEVQRDLPDLLERATADHPSVQFLVATLEEFVAALRPSLHGLPVRTGELLGAIETPILRGINSSRMYLKQANEQAERALLVAETLAALAALQDGLRPEPRLRPPAQRADWLALPEPYRFPVGELRVAWKELLKNHPHDSISGCSVDEVHRDMAPRFTTAARIADRVRREALAALAGTVEPWTYAEEPSAERAVVNPLPWARVGRVVLPLPAELDGARALVAETAEGVVPAQVARTAEGGAAAVLALEVPGFGARQVMLRATEPGTERDALARHAAAADTETAGGARFEAGADTAAGARLDGPRAVMWNAQYRVTVHPSGEIELADRWTGHVHRGLNVLEDIADRGDEYTFCPLEGDVPWTSRGVHGRLRVLSSGPVAAEVEARFVARLPRALTAHRRGRSGQTVACPVRTVVRLTAGLDRVEFETTVENRAADHRLRVRFPAPGSAGSPQAVGHAPALALGAPNPIVRAEGHFAMIRRPSSPVWRGEGWAEAPAFTQHAGGAVASGDLALFSRGLPEYEAVPRPDGRVELALTLLRCIGWLDRGDLATRPQHAGPSIPTPDAQCQGTHRFEYAIALGGAATDVDLVRASQDYRLGLEVGPAGADSDGVLRVTGDPVAFSALTWSRDGGAAILRLYEPGEAAARIVVGGRGAAHVERVRLDETPLGLDLDLGLEFDVDGTGDGPAEAVATPGGGDPGPAGHEMTVGHGEVVTLRIAP